MSSLSGDKLLVGGVFWSLLALAIFVALLCHKGVSISAFLSLFSQSWSWVLGCPVIAFSQLKSFVLIVEGMLTSSIGGMAADFGLLLLLLLLVLLLFLLLEVIVLSLPSEFW